MTVGMGGGPVTSRSSLMMWWQHSYWGIAVAAPELGYDSREKEMNELPRQRRGRRKSFELVSHASVCFPPSYYISPGVILRWSRVSTIVF